MIWKKQGKKENGGERFSFFLLCDSRHVMSKHDMSVQEPHVMSFNALIIN
jgi:hypothetical protein